MFEMRCFTTARRASCENVLASAVFAQMAPLDPDWTTSSCTNSATSQRCCWTAPGVPRGTPPATGSPATWTPTWSGGIPAAKMTSWFSWRYVLAPREDMMSLPPAKIRESNSLLQKYSRVSFPAVSQISNVKLEAASPRPEKSNILHGAAAESLLGKTSLAALTKPFLLHLRNGKVIRHPFRLALVQKQIENSYFERLAQIDPQWLVVDWFSAANLVVAEWWCWQ